MQISWNLNVLYVILGGACELNCLYCKDSLKDPTPIPINPAIYDYIENRRFEQDKNFQICFYGGEPLEYIDQIKAITSELKGRRINGNFSLITNGKLITQELVDYFNENNFYVQVSWDGPNSIETRGYDVMQDKKDLLLKINNICFNTVLSNKNYPLDFINGVDEFIKQRDLENKDLQWVRIHCNLIHDYNCNTG